MSDSRFVLTWSPCAHARAPVGRARAPVVARAPAIMSGRARAPVVAPVVAHARAPVGACTPDGRRTAVARLASVVHATIPRHLGSAVSGRARCHGGHVYARLPHACRLALVGAHCNRLQYSSVAHITGEVLMSDMSDSHELPDVVHMSDSSCGQSRTYRTPGKSDNSDTGFAGPQ